MGKGRPQPSRFTWGGFGLRFWLGWVVSLTCGVFGSLWIGLGCVFDLWCLWFGWIVSLAMFGLDWIVVDLAQVWCG